MAPLYDPDEWKNLYTQLAYANYGDIITSQGQIDIRFIKGDVVCHDKVLQEPHFSKWKQWARSAQVGSTPRLVLLAHQGRISPAGAEERPADMMSWCPSSVLVKSRDSWLDNGDGFVHE
ncbi:MAG: hypothetical protein LQ347_005943 [Umbilicaria vellea]|nr:MAG: hypothetical protein LQ347_005943 [Umbilicaria vellea]